MSIRQIHFLMIVVLSLVLTGCGSVPTSSLKVPDTISTIALREKLTYTVEVKGITSRSVWNDTLAEGVYRAEYEDANGTYYRGPAVCVTQWLEKFDLGMHFLTRVTGHDGGIYVPKNKAQTPWIYYVAGTGVDLTEAATNSKPSASTPIPVTVPAPLSTGQVVGGNVAIAAVAAIGLAHERGNLAKLEQQPNSELLRTAIAF